MIMTGTAEEDPEQLPPVNRCRIARENDESSCGPCTVILIECQYKRTSQPGEKKNGWSHGRSSTGSGTRGTDNFHYVMRTMRTWTGQRESRTKYHHNGNLSGLFRVFRHAAARIRVRPEKLSARKVELYGKTSEYHAEKISDFRGFLTRKEKEV